jgi:hypothetical protein
MAKNDEVSTNEALRVFSNEALRVRIWINNDQPMINHN